MDEDRMLTTVQAAKRIGVTPGALAKWRQRGKGPAFIRLGYHTVRYRRSEVSRWIETHESCSRER